MDRSMTYKQHQARGLRRLAKYDEFKDGSGNPDFTKLAREVGVSVVIARYVLTGELPEQPTFEIEGDGDGTD